MGGNAALILQLLKKAKQPMTAIEIINRLYPGKSQPYINGAINSLVSQGLLIRHDTRPYTVELSDRPCCMDSDNDNPLADMRNTQIQKSGKEDYLKIEFNEFWNEFFGTDQDFYSQMTFEKLVKLKMAVSNINNLVTYKTAIMAADLVCDILEITAQARSKILASIDSTSENANGYDIEYRGQPSFVCEVKSNIPSGGKNVFGAAQKRELIKDIESLLKGKSKSTIEPCTLMSYYKFLGLYSTGDITIQATRSLVRNLDTAYNGKVEFFSGQQRLDKDKVYIIFLSK